ncbi:helix-turn-helix transcriptional regulator [Sporosarcina sp. Marseille-Q4943]|uniref:helix-turn-helix transcriptional regulator n=1 Tax=Sporosarcina sp. Marseille-Q4943 TaxID=2942204 RepID=UPI00208DC173|nr:helix-turn-helix transcriptional regulator [Sporosarcina sp. Marseille-Q4943]
MAENLHEKLIALRKERNWTKTDVARKLGIKTLSTYANWEYGTRSPDQHMIKEIATLYNVSIDYLYGHLDNSYPTGDDKDFENAIKDPDLKRWYLELPKSDEEDLMKLRKMWEIIKNEDK